MTPQPPSEEQTCPTCGSDDPDKMLVGPEPLEEVGMRYCPDDFHGPRVGALAPDTPQDGGSEGSRIAAPAPPQPEEDRG